MCACGRAFARLTSPPPAVLKWYENNTVLTVTSVGGLLLVIYTAGILWLVIYYRVVKPKAAQKKERIRSNAQKVPWPVAVVTTPAAAAPGSP